MPVFILSILIQVGLIIHVVKTGRNNIWIWVLALFPIVGPLAYVAAELLPELLGSRTGRRIRRNIESLVSPNKGIKTAVRDFSITDTVENSLNLAEEYLNKGVYEEAKLLYEKSLRGIHENDPNIMYGLAKAEFGLKHYVEAKHVLDDLIAKNPDYKNADAHLLYARAAEELGDTELALKEYEILAGYYPGPEAAYRYAMLLGKNGYREKAALLLNKIVHASRFSGRHYNSIHKEWISLAKNEVKRLSIENDTQ